MNIIHIIMYNFFLCLLLFFFYMFATITMYMHYSVQTL